MDLQSEGLLQNNPIKKHAERILRTRRKHAQRKKIMKKNGYFQCVGLETPKQGSSCRCCGNSRKTEKGKFKLSIQERKFYEQEL